MLAFILISLLAITISLVFFYESKLLFIHFTKRHLINLRLKLICRKYNYIFLKNIIIEDEKNEFVNFENIIIGDKFVYVITTKTWLGYLTGTFNDEKWLLYQSDKLYHIENPVLKNGTKLEKLAKKMKIEANNFINIVILTSPLKIYEIEDNYKMMHIITENKLNHFFHNFEKNININTFNPLDVEEFATELISMTYKNQRKVKRYKMASEEKELKN